MISEGLRILGEGEVWKVERVLGMEREKGRSWVWDIQIPTGEEED
jgi:hypothetical protein